MFEKVRTFLAFIVSPIIAIFIIQFFIMGWIVWPTGISFEKVVMGIFFGLGPMIIFYILLVLISIPVFLLVKYFFGWNLRTCIVSSVLITITSYIIYFSDEPVTRQGFYFETTIIVGAIVGSVVYGIMFWRIVSKSHKMMDKRETED